MPQICKKLALGAVKNPRFVVVLSHQEGKILLSRHRQRQTWETQGGHIEPGESPEAAARRELWEETGAVRYHLEYLCAYSVEGDPIDGVDKNYGVLYTATIETFEELPPMEMAEMRLFAELPTNMTYPQLQPKMALYAENVGKWKKEKGTP